MMQALSAIQSALLDFLGGALFEKQVNISALDAKALFSEANAHKVFPIVFDISKPYVTDEALLQKAAKLARRSVAMTVNINYAHAALGRLMEREHIPYACFKGLASSLYYPKPELRIAGDVDFYVPPAHLERCEAVLIQDGYEKIEDGGKHITFQKNDIRFELHRTLSGIPDNEKGRQIQAAVFGDLAQSAALHRDGQGTVRIPDAFHHGMILLLHTLSHMTKEGIGLRHLCDWALFASSFCAEQFTALFETKLKAYGLWRFAQVLSLCANRYLGAPYKEWQGSAEDALLQGLICDIMASGNFGEKDVDRYRQIKYIADRGDATVKSGSVMRQARKTIQKKAAAEGKSKAAVVFDYAKNVLSGKRKPDTAKTLESAAERKALYSEFHLFETEK